MDIQPPKLSGPCLPIILAHGICAFHRLLPFPSSRDNRRDDRLHYFRKIRTTLLANGFTTYHSSVSWGGSLERRASDLREAILRITEGFSKWPAVHIIAHSMGGLDARYMICRYRMERRVLSLTTIGTPHHGTAYADWGLRRVGFLIPLARVLGLDLTGFLSLTRRACLRLNRILENSENSNGVLYRTVAGTQPLERMFGPFRFPYSVIWEEEGPNDGLVSLRSAMWKERYFLEQLDADHINQIGWWDRGEFGTGVSREDFEKNIRRFYLKLAGGLSDHPVPCR